MEKEKTILNGNRLIAEFMGHDKAHDTRDKIYHYHDSWDWLMDVVDRIEKTKIGKNIFPVVTIEPGYCVVSENGEAPIREEQGDDKIENVWFAVIGFIEWYNARNY